MPPASHTHKSMLLRGANPPTSALTRSDIETIRGKSNRGGRSHGGAPLGRYDNNGRHHPVNYGPDSRGGRGGGGRGGYGGGRGSYNGGGRGGYNAHHQGPPPIQHGPPPGWVPPPPGAAGFGYGAPPPPGGPGFGMGVPPPPVYQPGGRPHDGYGGGQPGYQGGSWNAPPPRLPPGRDYGPPGRRDDYGRDRRDYR